MCSGPQRGHPIDPKFYMYVFNLCDFQSFTCIGTHRKNSLLFCPFLGQKKTRNHDFTDENHRKSKKKLGLLESKSRVSLSFKVFEVVFRIFENLLFDMPKNSSFWENFYF